MNTLADIKAQAEQAVAKATSLDALDQVRVAYLGKQGLITAQMKELGALPPEERKTFGAAVNTLKNEVTALIDAAKSRLESDALAKALASETVDITLPVRPEQQGSIHPITQVSAEIISIMRGMGFALAEGPDIEDDRHNFEALNFPIGHPAREMQDTFFVKDAGTVLRTHTSPVQIRWMENHKPPHKIAALGRTYRCDSDPTHSPMFHQVECLYVDKNIHMGHLKGCLKQFFETFFNIKNLELRFRPSFFPFTEPSAEVDARCSWENGTLTLGTGNDWLELGGCGMVHPNVLKNVGLDPKEWQGFAFGMGVDRMAMLKYGIPDIRPIFEGDVRWLKHYSFDPLKVPAPDESDAS